MNFKKIAITGLSLVVCGVTVTSIITLAKWQKNKLTEEEVQKLYEAWKTETNEKTKAELYQKALKAGYYFTKEHLNTQLKPIHKMKFTERVKNELGIKQL